MTESDEQKNCLQKLTWPTREAAQAAAIYAQWQYGNSDKSPQPYNCKYCNKWHLARKFDD